jgi:hypothetical protein
MELANFTREKLMSNNAMSLQELELETAELLPGRETLCVPSCAPHGFGFGGLNGVGNTAQSGLVNLSLLNGSPVSILNGIGIGL